MRVLIAGGYGVFGRHLARELLATTSADLVIAGRDLGRAEAACRDLGAGRRAAPLAVHLTDPDALEREAKGCAVVACTAGPFQGLPAWLPRAAVAAGAHWVDIADAPGWVLPILDDRSLSEAASGAGSAVMTGLSTLPALSGVLARWCLARLPEAREARVTLFIGNRNAKGTGATASALIAGFRDPAWVDLPVGRRRAYRFETPDRELFRRDLGVEGEFRVALEWAFLGRLVAGIAAALDRAGAARKTAIARRLAAISGPYSRFGTEAGVVQAEVWDSSGSGIAAAFVGDQRMVVLPCAMAIADLLDGRLRERGVLHPSEWRTSDDWIEALTPRGVRLMTKRSRRFPSNARVS